MISVIKIDRVRTSAEAEMIEALGATMIGVSLHPDPRFQDDRIISVESALAIKRSLKGAKYVGELDFFNYPAQSLEIARTVEFDYVQPQDGRALPADLRHALRVAGMGVIYANIEVSHDDDPAWILSRYEDEIDLDAAYFQISLLSEYEDSWHFLTHESPDYEEEIQVEDINQLSQQHNVLVVLDYTPHNVLEIIHTFSAIQGIALVLGDKSSRDDLHYMHLSTAETILRTISSRSG